ncbi:unnamed protein product, partial [Arabidopsis halleri]
FFSRRKKKISSFLFSISFFAISFFSFISLISCSSFFLVFLLLSLSFSLRPCHRTSSLSFSPSIFFSFS